MRRGRSAPGVASFSSSMAAATLAIAAVVALAAAAPVARGGDTADRREALLRVSEGQLPTDTGGDGKTVFRAVDSPELGGKALEVVYASGDSFGDRVSRVKDWKAFVVIEFDVLVPGKEEVKLSLTVRHRRTTGYPTRVDVPLVLKPGKNAVRIGIDEMLNVNGTVPDLSDVVRWYISCEEGKTPTILFSDIWLTGGKALEKAPADARGPASGKPASWGSAGGDSSPGGAPAPTYRVRGKIGDMDVDLVVTPEGGAGGGTRRTGSGVGEDPARLARIRAAKMPPVTKPVPFDTPEADAILSALEVFPPDNPWNQVVSDWPLHPDSDRIIASIGAEKPLRYNPDMAFILVPPDQPRVEVKIADYPGESDVGPFPVPDGIPIEGWPASYLREAKDSKLTLDDVQRDRPNRGGDRHGIVVDPVSRTLYEFFVLLRTDSGWQAAQASVFDLKTNALRPDGWTSADAAGLPIFPAVARYDELKRGLVEHAMRVTVTRTRRAYVAPATHFASRHENPEYPRMGERIRLKRDFDVSGFSPEVKAILKGLQKYGMLVADNGIDWAISVAPDPRIPVLHEELRRVKGSAFEVVVAPER